MRTIEEVVKEISDNAHYRNGEPTYQFEGYDVEKALHEILEIHKEERPHGKWIKEDKPWGGFGDRVLVNTCPFCKESFVYHGNNPKFCSECGADMRGDEDY